MAKEMTLIQALRDFFAPIEMKEFAEFFRSLTESDKEEYIRELNAAGYVIVQRQ